MATPLCLEKISKDWSVDNMKETGLNGYVYDFNVDYDGIAVDDTLDIHNSLIKKNGIVQQNLWIYSKEIFTGFAFLLTLTSANILSYTSMNKQECKARPHIVHLNRDEPGFFPFKIKTSKCGGSCNSIKNPNAKLCISDVVKNLNVKVFNVISITNETRHTE